MGQLCVAGSAEPAIRGYLLGWPLPREIWNGEWHLGKGPAWLWGMLPHGECRGVMGQAECCCAVPTVFPYTAETSMLSFHFLFFSGLFF